MDKEAKQRQRVCFSGRVQGVGFRYTTVNFARGYKIDGFVKNMADGRVELVLEGPAGKIEALLRDLTDTMGRHIIDVQSETESVTGEFDGFEVRY